MMKCTVHHLVVCITQYVYTYLNLRTVHTNMMYIK